PSILELDLMVLPAFPPECETHPGTDHVDVPVAERRQSERAIFFSILLVAYPDAGFFEQPNDGGQDLFPRHAGKLQVLVRPSPDPGQRLGEGEHPLVLDCVTDLPPAG